MKKLILFGVAVLAIQYNVLGGTNPTKENDPNKLEGSCWTYAGPGTDPNCWKFGTAKVTNDPSNPDCYIVECPAPFNVCCIYMSAGSASVQHNGEIITFTKYIVTNPGNDIGQGAGIIGFIH